MTGKTHIAGGMAACLIADTMISTYQSAPAFYISGFVGALLPDICQTNSKIGRRLPILSRTISHIFGHRKLTHSLLFLLLTLLLFSTMSQDYSMIRDGLLIGMLSHMILDACTVNGIYFFYPFKVKVRIPFYTRTGGPIEMIVFAVLTLYILLNASEILRKWVAMVV
ncbi:metal-dependent hydrolase [bacterium LRH843]|nr:metal-dependent hydrolase [bacterium LRH843]